MNTISDHLSSEAKQTKRLMVVDDDESFRSAISAALTRAGHEVLCASDGVQALKLLQTESVDVLIIDILMPEKDGLETLRELRRMGRTLPVIAMSGGGHFDPKLYLNSARVLGAQVTLLKPFTLEQILEELRKF